MDGQYLDIPSLISRSKSLPSPGVNVLGDRPKERVQIPIRNNF